MIDIGYLSTFLIVLGASLITIIGLTDYWIDKCYGKNKVKWHITLWQLATSLGYLVIVSNALLFVAFGIY